MAEDQICPICGSAVLLSEHYPNYVCDECFARAADENGRSLSFSNVSLSGGFAAIYRDTREERDSHVCFIDDIECRADEGHFGGIVIRPANSEQI